MLESRFNKVAGLHVFSCEICEIFKNVFFHRTPPVADHDFIKLGLRFFKRKAF